MEIVLLLMTTGVVLGFVLDKFPKIIQAIEKSISWAIYLLLFLLGISVGTNEQIINNLDSIGWQALVITIGGVVGSVLLAWLLYVLVFNKTKTEEDTV